MDRMRESIFNIIQPIAGLSFLDLFSGSGLMALEAYSRGADPVRAVEKDRGKREILSRNLSLAEGACQFSIMPAERFVMSWKESFDLIFLDPPFPYPHKGDLLARTAASRLVHAGTRILIHFPQENRLPDTLPAPQIGSTVPSFFQGDFPDAEESPKTPSQASFELQDERAFGRSIVRFYSIPHRAPV